jgi:hypothetical protein
LSQALNKYALQNLDVSKRATEGKDMAEIKYFSHC